MPIQPPAGVQGAAEFMNQYQQMPQNQVLPQGVQAGADFMSQYQQQPENQPPPQGPPPSAPPAEMAQALRASDYQMPQGQAGYFEPMQSYGKGSYGDPRAAPEAPAPAPEAPAPEVTEATFDEQAYLNAPGNEDLLKASQNDPNWKGGWRHYQRYGMGEGRDAGAPLAGSGPDAGAGAPMGPAPAGPPAAGGGGPMSGTPTMGPNGQYQLTEEQKAAILRGMGGIGNESGDVGTAAGLSGGRRMY